MNVAPVTPPVVANFTVYQIGVVPEVQDALKVTEVVAPILHAEPLVTDVGVAGSGLTVTIYATDGRQFGLFTSGVGFKIAYT